MKQGFQAEKIAENVYWVGAIDWSLRNFHGYHTSRGTTYNAYLVLGDVPVLIDTVKAPFLKEMLSRIATVIDPTKIDYIISNHAEMDHSGCLVETIEATKPKRVFASTMGVKALDQHFRTGGVVEAVKDGQTISLGNITLSFIETRMLHWPDSMCTYLTEGGVLFSQDGFGMHLASTQRFDDQLDASVMEHEAAKYYANILLPYSPRIVKLAEKLDAFPGPINLVAPDHGPIWRSKIGWIIDLYRRWSQQQATRKAVIVYDTMWQSTALMARSIADGIRAGGASVKVIQMTPSHRSDIPTELLDAGALLVGSPTINNGIFPTIADAMCYVKGLRPVNLIGAAFGSYGWSGEAVKLITNELREMNVELIHDGLSVQYVPDDQALEKCHALGQSVAKKLDEVCDGGR